MLIHPLHRVQPEFSKKGPYLNSMEPIRFLCLEKNLGCSLGKTYCIDKCRNNLAPVLLTFLLINVPGSLFNAFPMNVSYHLFIIHVVFMLILVKLRPSSHKLRLTTPRNHLSTSLLHQRPRYHPCHRKSLSHFINYSTTTTPRVNRSTLSTSPS